MYVLSRPDWPIQLMQCTATGLFKAKFRAFLSMHQKAASSAVIVLRKTGRFNWESYHVAE